MVLDTREEELGWRNKRRERDRMEGERRKGVTIER